MRFMRIILHRRAHKFIPHHKGGHAKLRRVRQARGKATALADERRHLPGTAGVPRNERALHFGPAIEVG
jgi:hypothetical protein